MNITITKCNDCIGEENNNYKDNIFDVITDINTSRDDLEQDISGINTSWLD